MVIRNIVLCDIDHTLSNAFPRDSMIGEVGGWDAYHAASGADEPLSDMVDLINTLRRAHYEIYAITARPEKWRTLTMAWLVEHGVYVREILMRPDDAFYSAPEIKTKLAIERFGEAMKDQVAFIIDDRDDVCAAFVALGITALQCHARREG